MDFCPDQMVLFPRIDFFTLENNTREMCSPSASIAGQAPEIRQAMRFDNK